MDYDVEKARTDAIATLQTKRAKIMDDVLAGKFETLVLDLGSQQILEVSIKRFHSHRERFEIIGDLVTPDRTTKRQIDDVVSAARFYAYWGFLVNRLEAGEDPRVILFELVSQQ